MVTSFSPFSGISNLGPFLSDVYQRWIASGRPTVGPGIDAQSVAALEEIERQKKLREAQIIQEQQARQAESEIRGSNTLRCTS